MIPIARAVGIGPGPYNVLVDFDGKLVVVTWRTWKLLREGKIGVERVLRERVG
jgi:hypothetical protein